ncbi:MAG: hypothetical protein K2W96_22530 [Gemmataceae bacterium]|nr:hypothetical protein [Gemmataceae bacterium]
MRLLRICALLLSLAALPTRAADEDAKKLIAEQKARAAEKWKLLELGEAATADSASFHVVAPKAMAGKLKGIAATLEKYRATAAKAAALDLKEAHPGKITAYLLPDEAALKSFSRRVETRKADAGATGSYSPDDDRLHVAGFAGEGGTAEMRAGEMVASLLLRRKAGLATNLPEWLVQGFGRATTYRVFPKDKAVAADKKKAKAGARKKGAKDVWDGNADSGDHKAMQASLAEYLAYVAGGSAFPKFVLAFKPGENMMDVATPAALDAAKLSPDRLDKAWKAWASK